MKKLIPFIVIIFTLILNVNEVNAYKEEDGYFYCEYGEKNDDGDWVNYITFKFDSELPNSEDNSTYEPTLVFDNGDEVWKGHLYGPHSSPGAMSEAFEEQLAKVEPEIHNNFYNAQKWIGKYEIGPDTMDVFILSKYYVDGTEPANYYKRQGSQRCREKINILAKMDIDYEYFYLVAYQYHLIVAFANEGLTIQNVNSYYEKDQQDAAENGGVCNFYGIYMDSIEYTLRGGKACEGNSDFTREYQKLRDACSGYISSHSYLTTDDEADKCQIDCAGFNDDIVKACNIRSKLNGYCGSLGNKVVNWIFRIIRIVRYGIPALLIILSILDFIKAIASESDDEMKKVTTRFTKRLIAAALIFIIPFILDFILKMFNIPGLNAENPFCAD